MSTSTYVNEPGAAPKPSTSFVKLQGPTRAKGGTTTVSRLLIGVGVILFLVGMSYLNALVGVADLQDIGQIVGP